MQYRIYNGKIETRSLEIHITDHCNLRCADCCSLSPYHKPWFIAPEDMLRDLQSCAGVLKPRFLKLTGGEPLLHPKLLDCLSAARQSGVGGILSVSTNGLFLNQMPAEFWKLLDHLTLSVYPGCLTEDQVAAIEQTALSCDLSINIKRQDYFDQMHTDKPRPLADTQQTFSRCWLRHRCHMVRGGRFYCCTRPIHFDEFFSAGGRFACADGVLLEDRPELAQELLSYLSRTQPLASCFHCYGAQGEARPHQQLE